MVGFCRHDNEPLGSINEFNYFQKLTNYQLFNDGRSPELFSVTYFLGYLTTLYEMPEFVASNDFKIQITKEMSLTCTYSGKARHLTRNL